ncbi:MAG: DUF4139 domain-containing protein, partial [Deltaproteobacteria bacterium]|nr:DUF4139 domain-containing protein [Deltaproteobacteria bacterium]
PKLFPFVYHRLELHNPFGFPMMPGPIALYRNGTFTGRTSTKLRAPNEPVKLSLGVDNQVQVHRWVKEEKRYEPGVLSSTQRLVHRYEIQVGNWTKRRRKVLILENVPVAQVKELEVKLGKKTTKLTRYNKEDGIISWELNLAPGAKKTIVLEYTVHVPKDYLVRGYVTAK